MPATCAGVKSACPDEFLDVMTLYAALLWMPLFVCTPPLSPLRLLGKTLKLAILLGWPNLSGFDISRMGAPPDPSPEPISQVQLRMFGLEKLAMMVPKMSEYDSFSAPD